MFHLKLFKHYKALLPFCYTTNLYLILFLLAKKEEKYLCCVLLKIKAVSCSLFFCILLNYSAKKLSGA